MQHESAFDALKVLQEEIPAADGAEADGEEAGEGVLNHGTLWEDIDDEEGVDVQHANDRHCISRLACFAHTLQLLVRYGLAKLTSKHVRSLTAKFTKLCNLIHQNAVIHDAFEDTFGVGRSLPKANDTRWNIAFHHLCGIANLEQTLLSTLLREQSQQHLILPAKEFTMHQELVDLLQPFSNATDLTQGDSYPTISRVFPCIVALESKLLDMTNQRRVSHITVTTLLQESRWRRFHGLFQRIKILPIVGGVETSKASNSMLYRIDSLLDPFYDLLWTDCLSALSDQDLQQKLKDQIICNQL